MLNVSETSIANAGRVMDSGLPGLVRAVGRGEAPSGDTPDAARLRARRDHRRHGASQDVAGGAIEGRDEAQVGGGHAGRRGPGRAGVTPG